jgi:hypothetical protein
MDSSFFLGTLYKYGGEKKSEKIKIQGVAKLTYSKSGVL